MLWVYGFCAVFCLSVNPHTNMLELISVDLTRIRVITQNQIKLFSSQRWTWCSLWLEINRLNLKILKKETILESLNDTSIGITADKALLELINNYFYIRLKAITAKYIFLHTNIKKSSERINCKQSEPQAEPIKNLDPIKFKSTSSSTTFPASEVCWLNVIWQEKE